MPNAADRKPPARGARPRCVGFCTRACVGPDQLFGPTYGPTFPTEVGPSTRMPAHQLDATRRLACCLGPPVRPLEAPQILLPVSPPARTHKFGSISSSSKKRSNTKVASPTIGERRHRSIADARSTGSAMARRAWSRPRASMPHRPAARARPTRPTTSTSTLSSGADTTKKTAAAPRLDPEASALLPTNRRTPGHVWSALIARALSA